MDRASGSCHNDALEEVVDYLFGALMLGRDVFSLLQPVDNDVNLPIEILNLLPVQ